MTNKEKEILEIIRENPLIEQSEIAEKLGISRSTVAVHISSLQRQGYIAGKGYIISEKDYIVGIGAANVDIYGKSRIPLREHYDHPADIASSIGGVTHNIIVNYTLLGGTAKMITAFGDDPHGKMIREDFTKRGIDTSDSFIFKGKHSGIFVQIQDENNDMHMAVCDMSVLEEVTPELIRSREAVLRNAKIVVIDPSLREDCIEAIISICQGITPIFIDPISDNYALKLRPYVQYIDLIKPNRSELESLSGMPVSDGKQIEEACVSLIEKGLKKIVLSMSKDGILYMDKDRKIYRKLREEKHMVNASGAGDALMAAILYGTVEDLSIEDTLDYGLAAGIAAIRSMETINEKMSISLLDEIIKENKE